MYVIASDRLWRAAVRAVLRCRYLGAVVMFIANIFVVIVNIIIRMVAMLLAVLLAIAQALLWGCTAACPAGVPTTSPPTWAWLYKQLTRPFDISLREWPPLPSCQCQLHPGGPALLLQHAFHATERYSDLPLAWAWLQ